MKILQNSKPVAKVCYVVQIEVWLIDYTFRNPKFCQVFVYFKANVSCELLI